MKDDRIKQKIKDVFGKNADKYITSEIHAKGDDLNLLVEWIKPQNHWVVLDIATGGGHVAKALAPHAGMVFSTDLTEKMLSNTAKHLNKDFNNIFYVVADAEKLPFLEETFDLVTCRIAPHHFPNPAEFIKEASRVLKPGGKFLLIDNVAPADKKLDEFMNTAEKLRDESHVRCLTKAEWRQFFTHSSLKEVRDIDRKKNFIFKTWVVRTASSQQQMDTVEKYILKGDEEIKNYFSVTLTSDGSVESHQIDEWMVLTEKI